MSEVNLTLLPAPQAIEEIDAEAINSEMKAAFLANNPDMVEAVQYESDPVAMQFRTAAAREAALRARVNDGIKACMVPTAESDDLDNLVASNDTARQVLRPADDSVYPPIAEIREDDDRLVRRFLEKWNAQGAGASGHYRSLALDASTNVIDAYDFSPSPCKITVYVLSEDGPPDQATLDAVTAGVTDPYKRPQGDRVTVSGAEVITYEIAGTLTIPNVPGQAQALAAAQANVEALTKWSRQYGKTPLGRKVSRNLIIAALAVEGVTDIDLSSPINDISPSAWQAAKCTAINLAVADE